jgi:molybdenum cofactor guanylyltransferase
MYAGAEDIVVAILAGGAGVRVGGVDKGLLPLCGKPLIEHVVGCAQAQGVRLLIVANRNVDTYARFAPVVHDESKSYAGPLAGLAAMLGFVVANGHALPRRLLTVPVDCPDPPRDLATRLRAALLENTRACCARLVHAGKPEPLLAMYRIDTRLEALLASARAAMHEHGSVMRWQAGLDVVAVAFDDSAPVFHNLNTPEDFADYARSHAAN